MTQTTTDSTLPKNSLAEDRESLENVLQRRFFLAPSFEIYGGIAGLYDFGPPGTALLNNFIDAWRHHFVLHDDMLEMDATILTPFPVLKTSGHVDRFCDWMVKDVVNGEIYRADHLVENVLSSRLEGDALAQQLSQLSFKETEQSEKEPSTDLKKTEKKTKQKASVVPTKLPDQLKQEYEAVLAKIDNYDGQGLHELIKKYKIQTPTGNEVSAPIEFNLMFDTSVGPTGAIKGYLRPETAQGQFVNFLKLLDFNNGKMPFASASIGRSFRNEISPRNGLLRVREFLMAEIEHFVDPLNKKHPGFEAHRDVILNLLPASTQLLGQTTLTPMAMGEAVEKGIINNQTLGYFLARVQLFLVHLGIQPAKLRFRQHMQNEMAHYACDCWDAELLSSSGWIECVGCADRSAYDLTRHSEVTGRCLKVRESLPQPITKTVWVPQFQRSKLGPAFKQQAKFVEQYMMELSQEELIQCRLALEKVGHVTLPRTELVIRSEHVVIQQETHTEHVREYIPNVIEPSFGIGRILHCLLEHTYYQRDSDPDRSVFRFPPKMAPMKVLIVPLSNQPSFQPYLYDLRTLLKSKGFSCKIDDSAATIGKKYARWDELGTPFAITVDFDTVLSSTVTLRERDSTHQVRGSIDQIVNQVVALVQGTTSWEDVVKNMPVFVSQSTTEEEVQEKKE